MNDDDALDRRLREYYRERLPRPFRSPLRPVRRTPSRLSLAASMLIVTVAAWYAATRPIHRPESLSLESGTATVPVPFRR